MHPLLQAAWDGNVAMMAHLIEEGFDPSHKDGQHWSALMYAAYAGRAEAVAFLLKRGADPDVNEDRSTLDTPLSLAAYNGFFRIVKLLVAAGADTERYAGVWVVPAEVYARRQGYHHISEFLAYHAARPRRGLSA